MPGSRPQWFEEKERIGIVGASRHGNEGHVLY